MRAKVQMEDFDVSQEIAALTKGDQTIGAIASFIGTVRGGPETSQMELEHYPGMTEAALEKIAATAEERWELTGARIIHRYGVLKAGDRIVLALAASAHRRAAFEAVDFMMDILKTKAPFWKRELTADGDARWVSARSADKTAAERWDN